MEEDTDLKELIHKVGIWLFVFIVFGGLFTIILTRKFGSAEDTPVLKKLENDNDLVILFTASNISNLDNIRYELNRNSIYFEEISKDRKSSYNKAINILQMEDIIPPAVVQIKDRRIVQLIEDIRDVSDLKPIIEYNIQAGRDE